MKWYKLCWEYWTETFRNRRRYIPIRYSVRDRTYLPSLHMLHVLLSHTQDLQRRRKCMEMSSRPEVAMNATISSLRLIPSGATILVLKSPDTSSTAPRGR